MKKLLHACLLLFFAVTGAALTCGGRPFQNCSNLSTTSFSTSKLFISAPSSPVVPAEWKRNCGAFFCGKDFELLSRRLGDRVRLFSGMGRHSQGAMGCSASRLTAPPAALFSPRGEFLLQSFYVGAGRPSGFATRPPSLEWIVSALAVRAGPADHVGFAA